MQHAPNNTIASFVPQNSAEEKPLWFFAETVKVGKTIKGILIMRFTDTNEVEMHEGAITMRKDGIMFNLI